MLESGWTEEQLQRLQGIPEREQTPSCILSNMDGNCTYARSQPIGSYYQRRVSTVHNTTEHARIDREATRVTKYTVVWEREVHIWILEKKCD